MNAKRVRAFNPGGQPCYGRSRPNEGLHMPAEIKLFACLKDNYGVLIHDPASGATGALGAGR